MSAVTPAAEVAASVETPVMVAAPMSVIAPPVEVTTRLPVAVVVPRMMPPVPSTRVTFAPLLLTAPTKLLVVVSRMMSPGPPAVRLLVPVTVTELPIASVMEPAVVVSVKLPLTFRPLVVEVPAPATATEVKEPIMTAFASR